MENAIGVEEARPGGPTTLRGRPSSTREEWETARETDVADLNRLLEAGGRVEAYVAPLWSNLDAERCLHELRGFDEARVYLELASGEGQDAALAAIAASEWAGAAPPLAPARGGGRGWRAESALGFTALAEFVYACAGLEIPVFLPGVEHAERALALALGEDLTPREIEAVLRGESTQEPDAESLDHARELLNL